MIKRWLVSAIRGTRHSCSGATSAPTISMVIRSEGNLVKYDDHRTMTKAYAEMIMKSVLNKTSHCEHCGHIADEKSILNKAQHAVKCPIRDVIEVLEHYKSEEYEWFDAFKRPPQFNERVRVKREDGTIDEDTLIITGKRSMDFRKSHNEGKAYVTHWSVL